jgi:hypothetical protein
MLIKIFSNFCNSNECKITYERLCETHNMQNYGIGKEIYITTGEDYTHAIILNTAMPVLKIPKENVIGLAFEPPAFLGLTNEFINYALKHIGKYFIGDTVCWFDKKKILPTLFREEFAYTWHSAPLRYIPVKNKLMSIMVSLRNFAPGHKYRHTLVEHILNSGYPIDIYGNGATKYGSGLNLSGKIYNKRIDARIKGKFKELEPYENYQFHICIENFKTSAYFSEKISNALLCGTTPIYWGCKKILDMFPRNVILLSGNITQDMTLLRDIILNPRKYRREIDVEDVKVKLNLLKNLDRCFSTNI